MKLRVAALKNSAAEAYIKLIRPDLYNNIIEYSFTTADEAVQALRWVLTFNHREISCDDALHQPQHIHNTYRNNELDIFMHDSPVIDYIVSRENYNCDLKKLSSFSVDSYGAAFPRNVHSDLKVLVLITNFSDTLHIACVFMYNQGRYLSACYS